MYKKLPQIIALLICCILIIASFSGCIEEEKSNESKDIIKPDFKSDQSSKLPD